MVKTADMQETPLERIVFDFDWLIPPGKQPDINGDWTFVPFRWTPMGLKVKIESFVLFIDLSQMDYQSLSWKTT